MFNLFKKKLSLKEQLEDAIHSDNLKAFQESKYENKLSNEILILLYKSHSYKILNHYSHYINIHQVDSYNFPLWWNAFYKPFGFVNYESFTEMVSFLKVNNVDFNACYGNHGKYSLFYELLRSYNYKMFNHFLSLDLVEFKCIHHEERLDNLAHCISFLERNRYYAFLQRNIKKEYYCENSSHVYIALEKVIRSSDLNLKNKNGDSFLDRVCLWHSHWMVEKFSLLSKLNSEQLFKYKYVSSYHSKNSDDFKSGKDSLTPEAHQKQLYREVIFNENGIIVLSSKLILDKQKDKKYLSVHEINKMGKVILPNGTELFKETNSQLSLF